MAERLDEFEFRGRGGHPMYPWTEWFDGNIWKLTEGEDYNSTKPNNMRAQIYVAAVRHGLRAHVAIVDGGKAIVCQAYPKADKP